MLLLDAAAGQHGRGCSWRAEGLRELLFRGGGAFNGAGIFETLLGTQVDFDGAVLAL